MIIEFITMNGYGVFVWSSFFFTFLTFLSLYYVIKSQLIKEQNKFKAKYFDLNQEKSLAVKQQKTYREILAFTKISKI